MFEFSKNVFIFRCENGSGSAGIGFLPSAGGLYGSFDTSQRYKTIVLADSDHLEDVYLVHFVLGLSVSLADHRFMPIGFGLREFRRMFSGTSGGSSHDPIFFEM